MNNYFNRTGKLIILSAMTTVLLIACEREAILPVSDNRIAASTNALTINETGNAAAAHISASEKLEIPGNIDLPAASSRVATYYAVGVQKYGARIKAGSNPISLEWFLIAPDATLYDTNNQKVGTHTAGPNWTLSPADIIFAQHFSPARTAPSTDIESIDWLLLMPKTGTTPTGIFADVDYIQRIATKGGKAPVTPPASLNETVDVKYQAVYRFSKQN